MTIWLLLLLLVTFALGFVAAMILYQRMLEQCQDLLKQTTEERKRAEQLQMKTLGLLEAISLLRNSQENRDFRNSCPS